ncbi:hypothetical protein EBESD8_13310 [Rhodococcus aetherivorans]|nr:hypothetical protein EBESD8_13310 [Rhodococcus aetherivorans]
MAQLLAVSPIADSTSDAPAQAIGPNPARQRRQVLDTKVERLPRGRR